jgi:phage baseplate assembly protein V
MSIFRLLAAEGPETLRSGRLVGVVPALVTNNDDPDKQGRVKVKFPWLTDKEESDWARVAAPYAGKERGLFVLPEVGDEVLVAFEHGEMTRAFVLGTLWNGVDTPPSADGDGRDRKVLRTRSGHLIRLDDSDGAEKIEILDKTGKNTLTLDSAANTVTIAADKDIVLKAPQGTVKIDAQKVEIVASGEAKLEASGTMTVKGATVNLN